MTISDKLLTLNATKQAIKAAIEAKGVSTADTPFTQYDQKILKIQSSGSRSDLDAFLDDSLVDLTSNVTFLRGYGAYASKIQTANLPNVTDLGEWAFASCINLTDINAPNVIRLGGYCFYVCNKLTSAEFPNVTEIGENVFTQDTSLVSAIFPKLVDITTNSFTYCAALATTQFDVAETVGAGAFFACTSLPFLHFPLVTLIGEKAFQSCSSLAAIVLESPTVCTLSSSNAFVGTLIESGTGFIYVPDHLVDSYKSATNWITYADQITSINAT